MTVQKEIVELTKLKPKANEDRQDYLKRVMKVLQEYTDDEWDAIPTDAQNWANAAAKALNDDTDLPEFPGFKPEKAGKAAKKEEAEDEGEGEDAGGEDEDESEDDSEDEDEEEKKPAKKVAPKKTDRQGPKKAVEKEKPKAKAGKEGNGKKSDKPEKKAAKPAKDDDKKKRGGPDGLKVRIKKLILKNPSIGTEDLITAMTTDDEIPSKFTISNIRAEFRHSLRVLADMGLLTKEFKL